jgi:DNA-binding transcriptional regulator YiaG
MCGGTVNLEGHHKDRDRTNNKPQNIQTLCRKCHRRLHLVLLAEPVPIEAGVVAAQIQALRRNLGESQEVFAFRFGVSQSTVSRWEAGLYPPIGRAAILLAGLHTEVAKAAQAHGQASQWQRGA